MGIHRAIFVSVVCALLVSAAPSPKRSGKTVYENLISEEGHQFTQQVEIDLDKQTEVFRVPAHRRLDAAETMHDFKKGYSVTCYREKAPAMCMLADLSREPHFSPDNLDLGMNMLWITSGGAFNSANATKLVKNWVIVDGPLSYTAFLSAEMRDFLGGLPLVRVEPLPEDAEMLDDTVDLEKHAERNRRDILDPVTDLAAPKKCPKGLLAEPKIGIVREKCAYIYACKAPDNCRNNFHVTEGTFVRCLCCEGETTHNQCTCWNMNGQGIGNVVPASFGAVKILSKTNDGHSKRLYLTTTQLVQVINMLTMLQQSLLKGYKEFKIPVGGHYELQLSTFQNEGIYYMEIRSFKLTPDGMCYLTLCGISVELEDLDGFLMQLKEVQGDDRFEKRLVHLKKLSEALHIQKRMHCSGCINLKNEQLHHVNGFMKKLDQETVLFLLPNVDPGYLSDEPDLSTLYLDILCGEHVKELLEVN